MHGPDQVAKLAASMAEFGWTVPCLVAEDGELIAGHGRVLAATQLGLGSYGRPRMTEELKEVGVDVGHRRVGRLMRENGITVERTRKFKATTDSDHTFNIAPNLLDRDFKADQPNQKWAGDISYIWTREGWRPSWASDHGGTMTNLVVILDLHSRRVIGWAVSNRMKRDLAIRALKMAIAFRAPPKCCIFHSDRGSQYFSRSPLGLNQWRLQWLTTRRSCANTGSKCR
jgi:transposase InsO family protein